MSGAESNGDQRQGSSLALRMRKSPVLLAAAKRVVSRQTVDNALDLMRLRLDTIPTGLYQPVDCLPVRTATRAEGCESRWAEMRSTLDGLDVESAVDIGANSGYFSLELGSAGVPTIAIESDPPALRIALLAVRRSGLDNVGVLSLELRPDNVAMLPPADCVVFLSIWHHLVAGHGLERGTGMLEAIWSRTGKVLFFDTGEDEMPASFGLPAMTPDAETWLAGYLAETCEGSRVEHLGRHAAFDAEGRPCERSLFAVIREGWVGPG